MGSFNRRILLNEKFSFMDINYHCCEMNKYFLVIDLKMAAPEAGTAINHILV